MRITLALAFLAPLGLAQQSGAGAAQPVDLHTHALSLPGLPPDAASGRVRTAISTDGRIVAVSLYELGAGAGGESAPVWIHDVEAGQTRALGLQRDGKPWRFIGCATLSPDGRFVAAACAPDAGPPPKEKSDAPLPTSLPKVQVVAVVELATGSADFVDLNALGCQAVLSPKDPPSLSIGAAQLAIPTRLHLGQPVEHGWTMLWTRANGTLRPITLDGASGLLDSELSSEGLWLVAGAFKRESDGTDQLDGTFRINLRDGTSDLAAIGPGGERLFPLASLHALSDNAQRIAFGGWPIVDGAAPKDPGQPGLFVRDLSTGTTVCANLAPNGNAADGATMTCALSGDGRVVAFESEATNLVVPADDAAPDVFVRNLSLGTTVKVPMPQGVAMSRGVFAPALSRDGRRAVFAVRWGVSHLQVVLADIGWPVEPAPPR